MGRDVQVMRAPEGEVEARSVEEANVHEVYEAIAPHFSSTRYKAWPLVDRFLGSLPPGSIGLDAGGGNGKYLPSAWSNSVEMISLDRSTELLRFAQDQRPRGDTGSCVLGPAECVRGDLGGRMWREGVFDFAICIAAVHHLSTPERRQQAVQTLLASLRVSSRPPYSTFLIQVWAYEQSGPFRRRMGKRATRHSPPSSPDSFSASQTLVDGAPAPPPDDEADQDVLVPWTLPGNDGDGGNGPEVYHRYYHLFVSGELRKLVEDAAAAGGFAVVHEQGEMGNREARWCRVVREGWEKDNWWVEGEVGDARTGS